MIFSIAWIEIICKRREDLARRHSGTEFTVAASSMKANRLLLVFLIRNVELGMRKKPEEDALFTNNALTSVGSVTPCLCARSYTRPMCSGIELKPKKH